MNDTTQLYEQAKDILEQYINDIVCLNGQPELRIEYTWRNGDYSDDMSEEFVNIEDLVDFYVKMFFYVSDGTMDNRRNYTFDRVVISVPIDVDNLLKEAIDKKKEEVSKAYKEKKEKEKKQKEAERLVRNKKKSEKEYELFLQLKQKYENSNILE